jgi:tRNA(Met) cytidine acetyltransferase
MDENLGAVVGALRAEARRADQRRLLVLAGTGAFDAVPEALAAAGVDGAVLVGHAPLDDERVVERHVPADADALLGTTCDCVVYDAREECRPNALARTVGAVDGGGLFVLVTPVLAEWPGRRDRFDETLAVPPRGVDEVAGRFRQRLVALLREHPGIAILSFGDGPVRVEADGLTHSGRAPGRSPPPAPPADARFPTAAYRRCLTADQRGAVRAFETLAAGSEDAAAIVEADRGRGKSSAAGLAAGALAAEGLDVLVTAPARSATVELFARARAVLADLDALAGEARETEPGPAPASADADGDLRSVAGGRVRYLPPAAATGCAADVRIVDEAAGLPVALLERFLDGPAAFVTTVHGYEGAGRGFSVRFRERLAESGRQVTERELRTPIRYAADDPVEQWSFRALALDARPAVSPAVEDARPGSVAYGRPTPEDLLADEHRLREAFGLLVLAHYRTEPDDLARLLDAPNVRTRTLARDGRVVAVALLAGEGGLSADRREAIYRGARVRGNMLPDLLTGQLRDPDAAAPRGLRVLRIAVHPAVRSRGLGSRLLARIHDEFADEYDWFGTGFGATPRLVRFWRRAGYRTVHLSTTRNERSGEHSAAMLRPAARSREDERPGWSDGGSLFERHTRWFRERIGGVLTDRLSELDPDVVRTALAAIEGRVAPALDERGWRHAAAVAFGPGQVDVHPAPFRRLALAWLADPETASAGGSGGERALDARGERLLVRRVLQARDWETVAGELDYHSASGARRAVGEACRPLVERYGGSVARAERERYETEDG